MARYSHASVGFGNGDCIVGVTRPVDGVGFGSFSGSGSSIWGNSMFSLVFSTEFRFLLYCSVSVSATYVIVVLPTHELFSLFSSPLLFGSCDCHQGLMILMFFSHDRRYLWLFLFVRSLRWFTFSGSIFIGFLRLADVGRRAFVRLPIDICAGEPISLIGGGLRWSNIAKSLCYPFLLLSKYFS